MCPPPTTVESGETADSLPTLLEPSETTVEGSVYDGHPFPRLHQRWSRERAKLLDALSMSRNPLHRKWAAKIEDCCSYPRLAIDRSGDPRITASRCKHRLCPLCSAHRARALQERVMLVSQSWDQPRFMTLTLRSCDDPLADQVQRLNDCFRRMRQRKIWKQHVSGGVGIIEVTGNVRRGQWHPHLHILCDGAYFPQKLLKSEWLKVTGDSDVVDIRMVHGRKQAARYIAKYAGKPAKIEDLSELGLREYADAMHGRRLVIAFGNAHNRGLPPKDRNERVEAKYRPVPVYAIASAYSQSKPWAIALVLRLKGSGGDLSHCMRVDWNDARHRLAEVDDWYQHPIHQLAGFCDDWHFFRDEPVLQAEQPPEPVPDPELFE